MTGRMTLVAGLAAALALAGTSAFAQVSGVALSACTVDPASAEAAQFTTYDSGAYGDTAAVYFGPSADRALSYAVIENCPDRQALMVNWPADSVTFGRTAVDVFSAMLFSDTEYTVAQVAAQMREMGAAAQFVTLDYESCACAALAAEGTAP